MQIFQRETLSNGIKLIVRTNEYTPRTSVNIFINGGNCAEKISGLSDITGRLMLEGTKSRSAETIAEELDSHAIELDIDIKHDYSRLKSVFLNEDFDKAFELISDVLINPTFEKFEKERNLLLGEIEVDLDSPKVKIGDTLIRAMYPDGHPYGVVSSRIKENLPQITVENVQEYYDNTIVAENLLVVVVSHFPLDIIKAKAEKALGGIKSGKTVFKDVEPPTITEIKHVEAVKEDASQAQIMRGWYAPDVLTEDFAALTTLNNILGSAGLTSRLFVELRDKKGLAYHVRSSLEMLKYGGNFTFYIGTEPGNIATASKGFDEEIARIINEPVSADELDAAKKNILGKRAVFHETNAQQGFYLGLYEVMGLTADFDNQLNDLIKAVTIDDVQRVAKKYLDKPYISAVLAPSKYLSKV